MMGRGRGTEVRTHARTWMCLTTRVSPPLRATSCALLAFSARMGVRSGGAGTVISVDTLIEFARVSRDSFSWRKSEGETMDLAT